MRLADGRHLAVTQLGRPEGRPVVYCHGAVGSPLSASPELAAALERLDVRLVCVQRPGFGGSSPQPGRSVAAFADDVRAVADRLGFERFAVLGVSAGGPYAIACAWRLPNRVTAAAAVSSLSPACAGLRGLPGRLRRLARERSGAGGDWSPLAAAGALRGTPVRALLEDHHVTTRPWGFALEDVRGEVHVWHGMRDPLVPVEHALQVTARLARCRVWLDPAEGHFFFRRRATEILGELVSARATVPGAARGDGASGAHTARASAPA